jgi:hypothetical protein
VSRRTIHADPVSRAAVRPGRVALFGMVLVAFLVAQMVPADPLAVVLSD